MRKGTSLEGKMGEGFFSRRDESVGVGKEGERGKPGFLCWTGKATPVIIQGGR